MILCVVLSGCLDPRSPERAEADPWKVWICVLKGSNGDVQYVGSKGDYAYFRVGQVFANYYKTPTCNTTLPRVFDIGAGEPYVVDLKNLHGYASSPTCGEPTR